MVASIAEVPRRDIEAGVWFVGGSRTLHWPILAADRTPQNMTGWALEFEVRSDPSANGAAQLSKVTGAGVAVVDDAATNDAVEVDLIAGDTYNAGSGLIVLEPGAYWYSVRRTDDDSQLVWGRIILTGAGSR